jgi:putative spermidine/putrescine transport system permease protein
MPKKFSFDRKWLGVVPFFAFAFFFLFLPSFALLARSFFDNEGNLTLNNIFELSQPAILNSYWLSIQISLITAIGGGLFGFLLAFAITIGGLPEWVRKFLLTFSGVASNFAGVPLAFAFIAVLGRTGLISVLLRMMGWDIYKSGFSIYGVLGLSFTYMYFQFPLMVLVMAPALEGLRKEWREACENLGGTAWHYWVHIALPILMPTLFGTMLLLFGNAFGAYATAYALTGGTLQLITIQIGAQIRGDVFYNPGLGYAMALGMVVIMAISLVSYTWLQRRTSRWLQ